MDATLIDYGYDSFPEGGGTGSRWSCESCKGPKQAINIGEVKIKNTANGETKIYEGSYSRITVLNFSLLAFETDDLSLQSKFD